MEQRTQRLLEFQELLDHLSALALSEGAKRVCRNLQPISSIENLKHQTDFLREGLKFDKEILGSLQAFPSLDGVFSYLDQNKALDEDGLWGLGVVLQMAAKAREELNLLGQQEASLLGSFADSLVIPHKTRQGIDRCLDSDGELKDESSPELHDIRNEIHNIQNQCTKKVSEYSKQKNLSDYLQYEYLTISADRYVLALKSNFKGKLSGIIHDYSQTGETCYFEPFFLVELNNRLQELKQQEREAKRRILAYLTSLVQAEEEQVRHTYQWMLQLDLLRAKITLAQEITGQPIEMDIGIQVKLNQVRHPLLMLEMEEVQPIDIVLEPHQRGLVISGGNSGGKTVCLKTVGLVALMSLCALPVPAEEGSSLPFWEEIFVFLGDEQSIQEHLSTFTAQVEHFKKAWPKLSPKSLVLLDEFGAGTDPSQGAALAQAVLEGVLDRGSWAVAATHFPALKTYALGRSEVRSASVLFDPETKSPLYKLAYEQVGASQALDVAREYGMPPEILQKAEEYLLLNGDESSQLLDRLNQLAVQRETEIQSLKQERQSLSQERKRLKKEYTREMQQLIEEMRSYSREILQQWKEGKVERKRALRELAEKRSDLGRHLPAEFNSKTSISWELLEPGRHVYYSPWGRQGKVVEKDEKKRKVKLDLGGVNIWVDDQEIKPSTAQENPSWPGHRYQTKAEDQSSSLYLDLRGSRADEAKESLVKFLDKALLQGRNQLEIIHGKGTGALRRAVQEVLDYSSFVRHYSPAPEDRGGDGVTIVELQ